MLIRIIAALMLLIAFSDLPYAYYQILRWVVCGVTGYGAFNAYESKNNAWMWIFGITAVTFNPFAPFYFKRETWQLFDIAASVILFVSLFSFKTKRTNQA